MIKLRSLIKEKFEDWNDEYWVHYSNVDFLDVNEHPTHNDPKGIYLFPSKLDLTKLTIGNYFGRMKYKMFVKIAPLRVFDIGNLNYDECVNILTRIGHADKIPMLTNNDWVFKDQHSYRFRYYVDRTPIRHGHEPTLHNYFWTIFREYIFKNDSIKMTEALKNIGYDAIFDDTGSIMEQEHQLIVFDKSKIKVEKIISNDLKKI